MRSIYKVPGFETEITAALHLLPGSSSSRHVVIGGTSVVKLNKNSLILSKEFEGKLELEFEYAIIATGSSYAFPCRPTSNDSVEQVHATFQKLQKGQFKFHFLVLVSSC